MKTICILCIMALLFSGCKKVIEEIVPESRVSRFDNKFNQQYRIKQIVGKGRYNGVLVADTAKFYYNKLGYPTAIIHSFRPPGTQRTIAFKYTNDGRLKWILPNYVLDTLNNLEYSDRPVKVETTVSASIDPLTHNAPFSYRKEIYKTVTLNAAGEIVDSTLAMLDGIEVKTIVNVRLNEMGHVEWHDIQFGTEYDYENINNDEWGNNMAIYHEFDLNVYSFYRTHLVWMILGNTFGRNAPKSHLPTPVQGFGPGPLKYPTRMRDGQIPFSYHLRSFNYNVEYEPRP